MAHHLNTDLAEHVILAVRQRLTRSHDNAFTGVNTHRVKIFHVTHGHAVVEAITENLILHFLPTG